jgi:alkaline phosphatase
MFKELVLLIVTADHDHYLTLRDNYPELLRTVGANNMTFSRNTPEGAGHFWGSEGAIDPTGLTKYKWGNHSNRPVPVFYQGKGSEVLSSLVGQGFSDYGTSVPGIPGLLDQTHIARTQFSALETVPEPTTIAGILGFGASLLVIRRRK